MKYAHLALIGILLLLALLAGNGPGGVGAATDTDGDGVPDLSDSCPSLAEDLDGVDDLDGCPDTDVSVSAAMDETYSVPVSSIETRTVDIWVQNGNYPADILVHALSVSTVGACEVSLIAAPGDETFPLTADEDGDTTAETYYYLLEWEVSLDAGESYHTTRDYEVVCSLPGEHSFEMQTDAVPWPPVEEEDAEDLPNVHKSFPIITVTEGADPDSDGDGFSDGIELYVGTDAVDGCPDTPDPNDEVDDKWPADFNDDQTSDIEDIGRLLPPVYNSQLGDPLYERRKDLAPHNVIDIEDVGKLLPPTFLKSCAP